VRIRTRHATLPNTTMTRRVTKKQTRVVIRDFDMDIAVIADFGEPVNPDEMATRMDVRHPLQHPRRSPRRACGHASQVHRGDIA
jgi:hypothetical protein